MPTRFPLRLAQSAFVAMSIAEAILLALRFEGTLLLCIGYNIYALYLSLSQPFVRRGFYLLLAVMQLLAAFIIAVDRPARPVEHLIGFAALCLVNFALMCAQPKAPPTGAH